MSDIDGKINEARKALSAVLGDNYQKYWDVLRAWFSGKLDNQQCDAECQKLLPTDKIYLHNNFFISLVKKIFISENAQTQSAMPTSTSATDNESPHSSSNKRRRTATTHQEETSFESYDFADFLLPEKAGFIRGSKEKERRHRKRSKSRPLAKKLPKLNRTLLRGRFLLGAWEHGLEKVDDKVPEYMHIAIQYFVKGIISSVLMKRQHYKVTGEGTYYYDIGAPLKDPFLRNSVTRQKVDDTPLALDKELTSPNFLRRHTDGIFLSACEEIYSHTNNRITVNDFRRAFSDRNIVSSHTIYTLARERMTQMFH